MKLAKLLLAKIDTITNAQQIDRREKYLSSELRRETHRRVYILSRFNGDVYCHRLATLFNKRIPDYD
jgi:hypothetical protein